MQSTAHAEEWDESRLLAGLHRLQNTHIQLRNLRETIPCLIQPIHAAHASPTAFYHAMSRSATHAVQHVQSFQAGMREPRTQDVLHRARQSQERNPDGIPTWMVAEHADWLETRAEEDVKELRIREQSVGRDRIRVEEMRTAVERLNARKEKVLATIVGEQTIQMKLSTPMPLDFTITPDSEPQDGSNFAITCKQGSKIYKSALDAITTDTKGKDLDYILDHLASYADLMSRPCSSCQRVMDRHAQYPVARKLGNHPQAARQEERQWKAMHIGCL